MKVKDLIEQLKGKEDWDLEASYSHADKSQWGLTIDYFDVSAIADYGYSDKLVILSLNKEE